MCIRDSSGTTPSLGFPRTRMPCISRTFLKVYPKYIGGLSMRFHTAHSPETGTVPRTVIRWALPVHCDETDARRARLEAPAAWLTTSKYSEGGSSSTTARHGLGALAPRA